MIKCILVDNEIPAIRYLQTLCQGMPEVEVVKSFDNPHKALRESAYLDFNTCILDIHMPGINGLELAAALPGKAIIFSTAFKEFAADAFDLHAVDYLRKPYQSERLKVAFDKARQWLKQQQDPAKNVIELNTALGKTLLPTEQIVYIDVAEQDRRDKNIYLEDGRSILAKNISLDELLVLLPPNVYCRINRKNIVALSKVHSYTAQYVICSTQKYGHLQLSLSAAYKADFLHLLSLGYNI